MPKAQQLILPHEGLQARRHTLRQARQKLPLSVALAILVAFWL